VLNWLRRWLSSDEQDIDSIYTIIEELETEIAELKTRLNVSILEVYDFINGKVDPFTRRMSQRMRRQDQQEDLNTSPTKKTGIATPELLRKIKDGHIYTH